MNTTDAWKNGNYLRVRGEYGRRHLRLLEQLELPPRTRRILKNFLANVIAQGTTSAYAENTLNELGLL